MQAAPAAPVDVLAHLPGPQVPGRSNAGTAALLNGELLAYGSASAVIVVDVSPAAGPRGSLPASLISLAARLSSGGCGPTAAAATAGPAHERGHLPDGRPPRSQRQRRGLVRRRGQSSWRGAAQQQVTRGPPRSLHSSSSSPLRRTPAPSPPAPSPPSHRRAGTPAAGRASPGPPRSCVSPRATTTAASRFGTCSQGRWWRP